MQYNDEADLEYRDVKRQRLCQYTSFSRPCIIDLMHV